ncbi:MAG: hypothetical protein R3D98_01180 [Candidatus Krumholzibacteriia bacterium]
MLETHPVNVARRAAGKDPANAMWVWSPGKRPTMPTLKEQYGRTGAVISAVDLLQGIGVYAGMEKIIVPGATGLYDTDYEGKAAALDAIARLDVVYVHVEATDEAGHERNLELKIRCIEYLDDRITRPIPAGLARSRGSRRPSPCCRTIPRRWRTGRMRAIRCRWRSGRRGSRRMGWSGTTRRR